VQPRALIVLVGLVALGVANLFFGDSWLALAFFAGACIWLVATVVDRRLVPVADAWSRRLLAVSGIILVLWLAWAAVDALFDGPWLSSKSVGLVSLPTGAVLALASLVALARAAQAGRPKRYAFAALALSVLVAVVPFATLVTTCDNCYS
jgi:hypothetical protein